jgi:hypothetical protein
MIGDVTLTFGPLAHKPARAQKKRERVTGEFENDGRIDGITIKMIFFF